MQTITSSQITDQLADLDNVLADLNRQSASLSFGAVSGRADDVSALSDVQRRIQQANADRSVLEQAKATAIRLEATARDAALEAGRRKAMDEARTIAGEIASRASRVDAIAAELATIMPELDYLERQLWRALRRTDAAPSGGRVGQTGITHIAIDEIATAHRPLAFRPARRVAEIVHSAWGELLEPDVAPD